MKLHVERSHYLAGRSIFKALIWAIQVWHICTWHDMVTLPRWRYNQHLVIVAISIADNWLLYRQASPLNNANVSVFVNLAGLPLEAVKEITAPIWAVHWVCARITSFKTGACSTVFIRICCVRVVSKMVDRGRLTLSEFIVVWRLTHRLTCCGAVRLPWWRVSEPDDWAGVTGSSGQLLVP